MTADTRIRIMLFGLTFLVSLGITSLTPVLPLLASTFAVPHASATLVITVFALPGTLIIPFAGIWADRYGRKPVLLSGLILFGIAGTACYFAHDFSTLLVLRFLQGMGAAPLGLLYTTLIADTWQGELRAKMMSYSAMVFGLSTAVFPILGGLLAQVSWRLPFLLSLLAFPIAYLAVTSSLQCPVKSISFSQYLHTAKDSLKDSTTQVLLLISFLTTVMLFGPIITCFPKLAHVTLQAAPLTIGLLISIASIPAGIIGSQLPVLYQRLSTQHVLLIGQVFYIVALLLLPVAGSLIWIMAAMLLYGVGQGLSIPINATLLANHAPEGQRAIVMAVNAVGMRLAQALTPILFGLLAKWTSYQIAIACGGCIAIGTIWILVKSRIPEAIKH